MKRSEMLSICTARIPQEKSGAKPIELPVRYDKGGVWTVDEAADPDAYQAYVYYLFNR